MDWDLLAERIEQVRSIGRAFARQAHAHFGSRLRKAVLFGSAARGDWQEDSDIDVLLVLDRIEECDRGWIGDQASRMGVLEHGIPIATVTLSEDQFATLNQRERLFAREVQRDGLTV